MVATALVLVTGAWLVRSRSTPALPIESKPEPVLPEIRHAALGRDVSGTVVVRVSRPTRFDSAVRLRRRGGQLLSVESVRLQEGGWVRFSNRRPWQAGTDIVGLTKAGRLVAWDPEWTMARGAAPGWDVPDSVQLQVLVETPDGRRGLRARVDLVDETGAKRAWNISEPVVRQGKDGCFDLDGVPAGSAVAVSVLETAFARSPALARIPVGMAPVRRTPKIRLELASTIQGRLECPDRTAVGGVRVRLSRTTAWETFASVTTGTDGQFVFTGIPAGAWQLSFEIPPDANRGMFGVPPRSFSTSASGGRIHFGTLIAVPTGRVAGRVEGRGGSPVSGILVRLRAADGALAWEEIRLTKADGRYSANLPAGSVWVDARPVGGIFPAGPAGGFAPQEVAVKPGATNNLVLRLGQERRGP